VTGASPLVAVRTESGLSSAGCRDAWDALTRPLFTIAPLTPAKQFAATWILHRVGQLIVSQVAFTAQEFVHEPRSHDLADEDLLLLELYETGCGRGLSGETPTFIDPGRLHLVDLSRRYRTITTTVSTIGVVIPHAAVGYDPLRHPSYLALSLATPRGGMLAGALRLLVAQLSAVTTAEAPALSEAFAGLVRSLLLTPLAQPSADRGASLAARIRDYIDRHLAEELDAAQLVQRFGLSRVTLYRLFRAEGGIEVYIRERRLDRCSAELMLAQPERGRVREVAERLGFSDAGHFNRSFRRRFGVTPSDHLSAGLRASTREGDPPLPASVELFGAWLRRETARPLAKAR
jgi:AraC-like DNA-binding protein